MKKILLVFMFIICCVSYQFSAELELQKPIKECERHIEQMVQCSRVLSNGEIQKGNGVCVCNNYQWQGGCLLPEIEYKEFKETHFESCERTCSLGKEVKLCGIQAITDIEPVCGEWFCDEKIKDEKVECKVGEHKYTAGKCSYSTQICCLDGKWSEKDKPCKQLQGKM